VVRGISGRPEVALTFHGAGDPGLARQILGVLRASPASPARVTVLAVGSWLRANPDLATEFLAAGHELGNHTDTHPVLADLAEDDVIAEIGRCRAELIRVAGSPGGYFRQSGGQHSTPLIRAVAGRLGYRTCLSYDIDSLDWTDPGVAAIRRNAAAVAKGSIVSMHLGHQGTVAALPAVLADLAARGLQPVTATRLLAP
jgi:peptidoglycan/xylan/chitin deacetylase (PgdA/CDA1 family)